MDGAPRRHRVVTDFNAEVLAAIVAACVWLQPASAVAQGDSSRVVIVGTVVDPLRRPIADAEVLSSDSSLVSRTNAAGAFRLVIPRAGEMLVLARRVGFIPQLIRVRGDWNGTIVLVPSEVRLPDIVVSSRNAKPVEYAHTTKYDDVFRRRRMGLGRLIDRAQIDNRGASQTAHLLESQPGVRVQARGSEAAGDAIGGTMVTFSRCNETPPRINVYVDGRKLQPRQSFGGAAEGESILSLMGRKPTPRELEQRRLTRMIVGEMLERVNPSEIEMVEVFRGPGELPPEFNDGNCGAIAIWTR